MSDIPLTVEELQARVRDARASGRPLSPLGGGVLAHIGNPPDPNAVALPTTGLNRIVEYTPDDMVVIAQAGMTLASLQATLRANNQWLPVEAPAPERQTLGGIVATRAPGLARAGYGSVRDWLIGLQVVGGEGQIVRGGGKVVKNVSGYDLPKLYCGSFGTLGVITEVAFKVAPLPEDSAVLLAVLSNDRNSEEALDALLPVIAPAFVCLLNGDAAKAVMGDDTADAQYLVVRVDGVREAVAELAERTKTCLGPFAMSVLSLPEKISGRLVDALRDFSVGDAPLLVRFNVLSSQVGAFSRMLEWTASKSGYRAEVLSECRVGTIVARFQPQDSAASWEDFYRAFRDKADRVGGNYVIERMPEAWRALDAPVWSPVLQEIELMRGIKRALDPGNIFNPGRFVGGI